MKTEFQRIGDGPLLEPRLELSWEAGGVFAPAVIFEDGIYHMVYRAFGLDRISRLGYAVSSDGLSWRRHRRPLVEPNPGDHQEAYGIEDPRITKLENSYYITYTAATGAQQADGWHWSTRVHIIRTDDFKSFERIIPDLPKRNDKDAALFPRQIGGYYWMLHRYMPDIWVAKSRDLVQWHGIASIVKPSTEPWDILRIGAGATPIETELGWLLFYHGVSVELEYCMSALVLDIDDPSKVLYRLPQPLMRPEAWYEKVGAVPNVTFGTSAVDTGEDFWLYYGGADFVIAAASINKQALLDELRHYPQVSEKQP